MSERRFSRNTSDLPQSDKDENALDQVIRYLRKISIELYEDLSRTQARSTTSAPVVDNLAEGEIIVVDDEIYWRGNNGNLYKVTGTLVP